MNLKFIIVAIIVILVIITIIIITTKSNNNRKHCVLAKYTQFLETDYVTSYPPEQLEESYEGIKYTYSFWIFFVNIPENGNWNNKFDEPKVVLYRYGSPNVHYHPNKHILEITTTFKNSLDVYEKFSHEMENIEIQKWNHIAITLDNRKFNVYLNGELSNSTTLENVPIIFHRYLYLGQKYNNINGYVQFLEYYNDVLNYEEIRDVYNKQKNKLPKKLTAFSVEYYKKRIEKLKQEEEEKKRNTELNFEIGF